MYLGTFLTFLRFPKTGERRHIWELALIRDGFAASDRTVLCRLRQDGADCPA